MSKTQLKRDDPPVMWKSSDDNMLACSWQDTGRVNMLSTVGETSVKDVKRKSKSTETIVTKPTVQTLYNKYIGGVDKFDQLCATYPFGRRNKK